MPPSALPAVILAAGDGGRLGALTTSLPKPLIEIDGSPLIDYTLAGLAHAGVREAAIVTGYLGDQLVAGLGESPRLGVRLRYIENPLHDRGASFSLAAAREFAGGRAFLLVMADHLLSSGLLARLVSEGDRLTLVGADFGSNHAPSYVDEATKVEVDASGFVSAIGKRLERWHALDTGAFYVTAEVWDALDAAPQDCELSAVFGILAARRMLRAADVSGQFWYDIDTAADLEAAAELLPGPARGL